MPFGIYENALTSDKIEVIPVLGFNFKEFLMKRFLLSLAILGVCSTGIFAEENETKKNSAGFSFTIVGAELHYERNLSDYFSVLGSVSYTTLLFMDKFTVSAKGRFYPFGKAWYFGLGAGYMYGGLSEYRRTDTLTLISASIYFPPLLALAALLGMAEATAYMKSISRESGFLVQTNFGWKIPPGKKWAVLIDTGIDFNTTGISNIIKAGLGNSTESLGDPISERPGNLAHYVLPYLRLGFDFRF